MFVTFRQGRSAVRVRADEVVVIEGPDVGPRSGSCELILRGGQRVCVDEGAAVAELVIKKAMSPNPGGS
jgi:hypothetical protein